jgi:hypothetical protein
VFSSRVGERETPRLEPVLKFVRLPDGRWAMENGKGVAEITRRDLEEMHNVWLLWADVRWRMAPDA